MRKAVYAGSFDPFTTGHLDIVKQSSRLFDEVVVLLCVNTSKKRYTDINKMKKMIETACSPFSNVSVDICNMLVADYCHNNGCEYTVRGLRNTTDYLYEERIAEINKEINDELTTIYLRSKTQAVSSSMVKELLSFGKDVSKYLPDGIILNDND